MRGVIECKYSRVSSSWDIEVSSAEGIEGVVKIVEVDEIVEIGEVVEVVGVVEANRPLKRRRNSRQHMSSPH